jgi:hypothetical protein
VHVSTVRAGRRDAGCDTMSLRGMPSMASL